MMYLRWFWQFIVSVPVMVMCYLTNWIAVTKCDENGEIKGFFKNWQTWDDSCDPDDVWRNKELPALLVYDWSKHYEDYEGTTPELEAVGRTRWFSKCINPVFTTKEKIQRYICRVYWLTRNCSYGFSFWWFGANIEPGTVRNVYTRVDEYGEEEKLNVTDKYFSYANSQHICTIGHYSLFWNLYIGWKFPSPSITKTTRAMIANRVFAIKIKKNK